MSAISLTYVAVMASAGHAASTYRAITPETMASEPVVVRIVGDSDSTLFQVEVRLTLDSEHLSARRNGTLTVWQAPPKLRDRFGVPSGDPAVRLSCNVSEVEAGGERLYRFTIDRSLVNDASFFLGVQDRPGFPTWDSYEFLVRDFVAVKQ